MNGQSYIGQDPKAIPSITGNEHRELGLDSNGKLAWTQARVNPSVIVEDLTISAGSNAIMAGPITVDDLVTLTVDDGATLVVV